MLPNLLILLEIAILVPLINSCVERAFSYLSWVKNKLRNSLADENLDKTLRIVMESPDTIEDEALEQMVTDFKNLSIDVSKSKKIRISL